MSVCKVVCELIVTFPVAVFFSSFMLGPEVSKGVTGELSASLEQNRHNDDHDVDVPLAGLQAQQLRSFEPLLFL